MKSANIILSNTYLAGFYKIIDQIKQKVDSDKFSDIILVVPDKFSLNAEQIFMEKIGLSSVFNVWLTTFSRLIAKVVADDSNSFSLLSKNSGTMLVSEIILKNADKITTYKKISNNYALAETMFNVINLLKSSGVKPEELKNNFDQTNFGLKLKDIYLVYSEYEKAMKDKIDSITRLEIFDKKVKQSNYIKNSDIYFAMFESFTNVQQASLANLAKYAKSFNISLCANTLQPNHYIYCNDVFQKLRGYFENNFIKCNITNTTLNGTELQNFLSKNLLGFGVKNKLETNAVKLVGCDNTLQEVRYIASKIKYLVLQKGYNFDDINVAINGLDDYALDVQQVFDEFDLPYYMDKSRTMLDHYFVKLLLKIADFVCGDKSILTAIAISKNPIFDVSESAKNDFEIYCKKYNVFGEDLYKNFNELDEQSKNANLVRKQIFDDIKELEQNLAKATLVGEYSQILMDFLTKLGAKNKILQISNMQTDIIQKQVDCEVFDKFEKLIQETDSLLGNDVMDVKFYFDMIKSGLSSINLLTVPLKCDAVFVGDASNSTYYPKKIMFVCGACQSKIPNFQGDCGTITDSEISIFKATNQISPSIKDINKREKFKLFNLLTISSDRLEVTYSTLVNGSVQTKSEFISALQNICLTNSKPLAIEKYNQQDLKLAPTDANFAYLVGTLKNAIIIANGKDSKLKFILQNNFEDILQAETKKYVDSASRYVLQNAKGYLFDKNKTTISQIERYFRCPFMQFIDYGLSPKENQTNKLQAFDVGNILHKIAQIFVDNYIKTQKFSPNLQKDVEKIFDNVLSEKKYVNFAGNTYALKNLKNEAVRFCGAIQNQINKGDFKPVFTEKKFEGYALKSGLTISGAVDRVDCYDHNMRIIDYKTGKEKFNFAEVYYGIKLQLVVYLQVMSDVLKKNGVATFYMPVKNDFFDLGKSGLSYYKLDGVMLQDDGVIRHMDTTIDGTAPSEIIDVDFLKGGGYKAQSQKKFLSLQEFANLKKYCFDILNGAIDEMIGGYILPKPYKQSSASPCASCKYSALCHYSIENFGYRAISAKSKKDF